MPQDIMRQWFVPGEGIDRYVISTDIQRYLGNDATVRPGVGTGELQGVQGYWIKAYRNLTSAMIADLRADSARWRKEQRATGTRESYASSSTYHASAGRASQGRNDGSDSPTVDGPYGLPPSSRDRAPADTRMQIDPPIPQAGGYQPERSYVQDSRPYQPERGYAPDGRVPYPPDNTMPAGYGRAAPPPVYGQDARYSPAYQQQQQQQPNDGAPPGYVRQGNYYVPVTSSYEPGPPIPASRSEPPQYAQGPYGQPQPVWDPRDARYQQQPDYPEPRYSYPSPATTVSSVPSREREPMPSSMQSQPSPYGTMAAPQYDQYAGRPLPNLSGQSMPPVPSRTGQGSPGTAGGYPSAVDKKSDRRSGRR